MIKKPLILIVDDEQAILKMLKNLLEDEEYHVHTLDDPTKVLETVGQLIPDLVLLDIFMPKISGLELLRALKKEYPHQKTMIISGFGTISVAVDALRLGALDFIEKPLNLDDILSKLYFLKQDTLGLDYDVSVPKNNYEDFGIIGQSYLFSELMRSIEQIAPLHLPLLLYGGHGVGKTLMARYIHHKRYQDTAPFFLFDCQEQPDLVRIKEMLGTGFVGTVYLKHLNYLSLAHQQELLSILRAHRNNTICFIASSFESLFSLVQKNKFNASLFHFFNVVPLEIPSLNICRYDIPLLIHHFSNEENKQQNKQIIFSVASIRMLRNTHWVGNIAQLKEYIKTIVTLAPACMDVITPEFLQKYLPEVNTTHIEEQTFTRFSSLKDATIAFEKQFLLHVLKKNRYDLQQVSDNLSLNISQLRDKMLELHIIYK